VVRKLVTGRPTTRATEGMVATPHYLATLAGLRVLQDGGNAVDAAVAANAVLTVVYPHMCSLGGDAFFLIWEPREQRLVGLNGSGRAPQGISLAALRDRGFREVPAKGPWGVTVPGAVDAWATVLARYGTRDLAALLESALRYAEEGFPVSPLLARAIAAEEEIFRRQEAATRQFLPGGRPPRSGQLLRQPDLAASLRLIAEHGPEAFYRGPIAEAIVDVLRSAGGAMTLDDLAAHRSEWVEPLRSTYRGVEVIELPPNTQGVTALQLLNIVEGFPIGADEWGSPRLLHLMLEAKKLAFADRDRYLGDPAFVDVPVARLLSKAYAAELRSRIDPDRASVPPPPQWDSDTIYLCVVDRDGRAVSLIQSIYQSFGSGLVAAGIVLHNRGACFVLDEESPNALMPGKRPLHTLIPGMMVRDGRPWVVFGTMGGHSQPVIHLQLVNGLVDFGFEPQEAIEVARWVSRREPGEAGETIYLEPELAERAAGELARLGHRVEIVERWSSLMGHAHLIMIGDDGVLSGASDPRAEGYALGW